MVGGPWGSWVATVEDHQLRLEDTEQQMDLREQEDAANEVLKDANGLSREESKCDVCEKVALPLPLPLTLPLPLPLPLTRTPTLTLPLPLPLPLTRWR